MRIAAVLLLASLAVAKDCPIVKKTNSKLFCYYSKLSDVDGCYCTHVILPPDSDVKSVERVRERSKGLKVLVTVNEFNQGLVDLLKSTKVDGLEIKLRKFDSKNDISDFISTTRSKIGSDLYLAVSVPSDTEILAKYYDFKGLSKHADVFILQTAFLGASKNVTFHPSRLSGLWDMQNTDSVVDLVTGLGAPLSKLVVTAPVQAFDFTLQTEDYSAPGSPAVELRTITRDELCEQMKNGANWTLERDEDQAGPYIFSKTKWIAFEDSSSIDIKAKYSRVRGLAGLALKDLSLDGGRMCGSTLLESAYKGLSLQSRAPRGAVLHSLEREIQKGSGTSVSGVHLSPYRITRIIDTEGHWHVVRQDTRTEFTCSRQGYFVHPRSCNRFYRCVKFDQQTDEFSVFEFDCPSGLAFDERVEVCVWPGSLPQGQACSGSSEIAPVPRQKFECPHEPGYYADPENCRWFFACLDHGRSSLEAYEFRCPFGLVFDSERLLCEWPWLVPKCAAGSGLGLNLATEYHYGASPGSSQILTHYDGLGALGVIKLGGVSGTFQQPIIYSNIGGNRYGGIGIQAANSLYSAGLLKSTPQGGFSNLDSGFTTKKTSGTAFGFDQAGGSYSYVGNNEASANVGEASLNYNTGHSERTGIYSTSGLSSGAQSAIGTRIDQINGDYVAISDAGQSGEVSSNLGTNFGTKLVADSDIHRVGGTYVATSDVTQSGEITSNLHAGFQANSIANSRINQVGGAYATISDVGQHGQITSNQDTSYGEKSLTGSEINRAGAVYVATSNAGQSGEITTNDAGFGAKSIAGVAATNSLHADGTYLTSGSLGVISSQNAGLGAKTETNQDVGSYFTIGGEDSSSRTYPAAGTLGVHSTVNTDFGSKSVLNEGGSYSHTSNVGTGNSIQNVGLNQISSPGGSSYSSYTNLAAINSIGNVNLYSKEGNSGDISGNFGSKFDLHGHDNNAQSFQTVTQNLDQNKYQSINIVGGGYSAVGQSSSGLDVTNIGEVNIGYSTTPISVSTYASVPTVTSVPIPTLNTPTGFDSYNGGVIANVPGLQYRVHGETGIANVSKGFPGFVSTTVPSVQNNYNYQSQKSNAFSTSGIVQSYDTNDGYVYDKPKVSFEEGPTTVQPTQKEGGYVYSRPSIKFEETPVKTPIHSAPTPFVVQPAVSTYTDTTYSSTPHPVTARPVANSYSYIHSATTDHKPVSYSTPGSVNTYKAPAVSTYSYSGSVSSTATPVVQPAYTYSTGATPVVPIQPISSSQDSGGYVYTKPTVKFEENPVKTQLIAQKPDVRPAASYSFSIQNTAQKSIQEARPQYTVPFYATPKPIYLPQPQVYVQSTPAPPALPSYNFSQIEYEFTKPVVPLVQKFTIKNPASSFVSYQQQTDSGYYYQKPSVQFNEPVQPEIVSYKVRPALRPIATTYRKPAIVESYFYQSTPKYTYKDIVQTVTQKTIQPVVSTYLPAINTYHTEKSRPVVASSTPKYTYEDLVQTVTKKTVWPEVSSTVKPVINTYHVEEHRPVAVSSYNYVAPKYAYKDVVQTVTQKTIQPLVPTYLPATAKPLINTYLPVTEEPRPVVSYNYVARTTTKPTIIETPVARPAVVSSYSYVAPSTPKPILVERPVVNTYLPIAEKPKPVFYNYPKPVVYKAPVVKPAIVSSYSYVAPKVSYVSSTTPQPAVISNNHYVAPVASYNYVASSTPNPILVETPRVKPAVVSSYSYISPVTNKIKNTPRVVPSVEIKGYDYPKPSVTFVEEPRPVVTTYEEKQPPQEVPFVKKTAYVTEQRSDYVAPARPVFIENYQAEGYAQSNFNNVDITYSSTPKYVSSTPRPTFLSTVTTKVQADAEPGTFYYYDSRLTSTPKTVYEEQPIVTATYLPPRVKPVVTSTYQPPRVKPVVTSTYLPPRAKNPTVTSTYLPPREYLPVTTVRPTVKYSIVDKYVTPTPITYIKSRVKVTTPSNEYLPVRSKVRYSTTTPELVGEYLPVKITTAVPLVPTTLSRNYLPVKVSTEGIEVGTRRPAKVVKVIRPAKTIIKQNDFLPMLSTKLGAQCTCASSNLRLRKNQKVIIVNDEEEDDDDDGYVVDDDSRGTIVENYSFEPEKVIHITPTQEVSIKAQRVRVQPAVQKAAEVFLEEDVTATPRIYSKTKKVSQEHSDKEIADLVRSGLKLVKQAAKEGAVEGAEEAIARVRETIECQRAGLFRHPNQCNKFYSCRWDCTKNKYVLHTFNCPVHLTFDSNLGACNWPSQGPACADNTLLPAA